MFAGERPDPEDQSDAYRYWLARGGTPGGLNPDHAPIPVSAAMRLWLRLDEDLVGGMDGSGCYPTPQALRLVIDDNWTEIETWFRCYRVRLTPKPGYRFLHSISLGAIDGPEMRRTAMYLIRCLGAGRAEVQAEDMKPTTTE